MDDTTENSLDKAIVNDAAGRVLRVTQGGNNLYTHIVNGQILGRYGVGPREVDPRTPQGVAQFEQVADFEFGYRGITGSYPAPGTGSYTVRQGDTLQAIAQGAWGDSSQWWRIAQANGLSGDRDLRVGQTLTLPANVAGASNDGSTFRPYDAAEVVGDTSPNLPQPAGQGGGGCGAMGMVLMIVVAVAVTVFSAGVGALAMAGSLSTASLGGIMTAGASALSGGLVGGGIAAAGGGFLTAGEMMAAAAIGGAVGSIAGQGVGVAVGAQDSFSWKNVAMSAVGAAVTSGVGGAIGGSGVGNAIVRAAVSNAMTQGISFATGLQDQFSWASVAASAAGAAVGGGVNQTMGTALNGAELDAFSQRLVTGTAAGLAAGTVTNVMHGGRVSVQQIATDAFGNALGSSIAGAMQPTQGEGPWSSADYRNGSDIESDNYVALASMYSGGQAWTADVAARQAGASGRQLDELLASVGAGGVSVDTRPGSVYVQAGDSLGKIAARFPEYGNANDLKNQLIAANPQLSDPNALTEGMELNFPGAGTVVDSAAMARAVGADGRYQAALAAQQPEAKEPVWSFREASMAQRQLDDARALSDYQSQLAAKLENAPSLTSWSGNSPDSLERTRLAIAAGIALPTVLAPTVIYGAPTLYELGAWGVAFQTGMKAATELGATSIARGMATSGLFSAATYVGLQQEDATPAGVAVAFGAGAIGGGLVKQSLNFAAGLSNTAVPLTWSNVATSATGFTFGFGTVGWLNGPPFLSAYGAATHAGQSWWTTPVSTPPPRP